MERLFSWEKLMAQVVDADGIDDIEELRGIAEEAELCGSWRHFYMECTDEGMVMYKGSVDLKDVEAVVSNYCGIVEDYVAHDEDEDINGKYVGPYGGMIEEVRAKYGQKAIDYDKATQAFRGADDGTYDYAGSYVTMILELMIKVEEVK